VCTLLQSRKVLVSVVWATSSARRADWARQGPTAAAGRLHTITSRANLVLWHMHVPLPWHMHLCLRMIDLLPCHQTRPANRNPTLPSFASGSEIGKNCALRTPTIPIPLERVSSGFAHIIDLLATHPSHHHVSIARRTIRYETTLSHQTSNTATTEERQPDH
jgi:hypothetical protein